MALILRLHGHPWPVQPWPDVVAAKVRPVGQAVAPPGDRGRRGAAAAWRIDAASIRKHALNTPARGAACGRCVRSGTALTRTAVRGCPCPGSRRRRPAEAWMPERRRLRESGAQDGRSERPATGHGQPRAVPLQMSLTRFRGEHVAPSIRYAVPSAGGASLGGASSGFFDSKNCFKSPNVRSGSLPVFMAFVSGFGGPLGLLAT